LTDVASGLLVCGTASNAGKTTVVAALCRVLARRGVRVAPFKAQNMSLNSAVTAAGHEIARAQYFQAAAAGVVAEAAMNPILVKPGTDQRAHLVLNGKPAGDIDALDYLRNRDDLRQVAVEAYRDLAARFEIIVCEGAGSAAEINLREHDIANLGFAHAVDIPVVLVADIDRGGVFASLIGTLACLDDADRARVAGYVINRFRGDGAVLQPGLDELSARTGRPVFGVLPFDDRLRLDSEDSLAMNWTPVPQPPVGPEVLRVVVVRLPRASNLTDVEPLAAEPGVVLTFADVAEQLRDGDVVIVPGTRATVADLQWVRARGFDAALEERARQGRPIFGICGGYQMLGERIVDYVESVTGVVPGLGLLPISTVFAPSKVVAARTATMGGGTLVTGYQIHHGRVARHGGCELIPGGGCRLGAVAGTTWHGLFDNDEFRRGFLRGVAIAAGRDWVAAELSWAEHRLWQLDRLADAAERHLMPLVDAVLTRSVGS
jgi:adenosylcobyric acid synthase